MCLFLFFYVFILQVFENGKDTGEISVYISRKDLKCDSPAQGDETMQRVSYCMYERKHSSCNLELM